MDRDTQDAVAAALWTKLGFQNLSVDALALIAEDTLVDDDLRKEHGIHSTPRNIARYVVEHLPIVDIPEEDRIVVEPCAGHGVFLVAALKQLRHLLGAGWTDQERHRYFVRRLRGFELDPFAREVNKLCLTLADFPNPNGWSLEPADVFTSRGFTATLGEGRIVLCNPPFEDFKCGEKAKYGAAVGTSKPLEVLRRVLHHSHKEACLGFVLPLPFVDGQSYRQVRKELAERFSSVDFVALPDRVFRHAEVETVLLLAHSPVPHDRTRVQFSQVLKPQLQQFLKTGSVSRSDTTARSVAEAEVNGFNVPVMQEVWEHLAHLPSLASIAEIHRGVEWQPPFDESKYISLNQKVGWWHGLRNVAEGFEAFSPPNACWLNPEPKHRRGGAWSLPWNSPKVIANAARKARGSWRLAASPDVSKLVCTQRYHCLWPTNRWGVKAIAGLLNSPLVSAFIASHEGNRDVRKMTLQKCPIPSLSPSDMVVLEGLVDDYMAALNDLPETRYELWGAGTWQQRAKQILLQMDALLLKGYGLPPWLERRLLEFFRGHHRPVPFDFGDYFPADFSPNIPLWRYISPSFQASRTDLILPHLATLNDPNLSAALEDFS
ncbi:MAG: N-6 DNA methylase [Verrucomicrobia bacterium]|nr:N-6 DNA methylase [Verrucomicrobiota bacterium]